MPNSQYKNIYLKYCDLYNSAQPLKLDFIPHTSPSMNYNYPNKRH
jgi:hypothetical protein